MTDNRSSTAIISTHDAVKTYGATTALAGVTLEVFPGEVHGVVGHNGAGKSTLMRALAGLEPLSSGSLTAAGQTRASAAGFEGVRMAFQETSLAGELTVAQNAYISARSMFPATRWRSAAGQAISDRLAEIFPGSSISPGDYVDDLTLAGRQMVEIARATLARDLKVLILDEPTESLTADAAEDLYRYVGRIAHGGVGVILISQRLGEILAASGTVTVLKDGAAVDSRPATGLTERDLFIAMGGDEREDDALGVRVSAATDRVTVRIPIDHVDGTTTEIVAHDGEVVGFAGIAGQGQEETLEALWRARGDIDVPTTRAYVPGDRQRFGIFPLWNVSDNLTISSLRRTSRWGVRRKSAEKSIVSDWVDRLRIRGGGDTMMTGLSGGNQQKTIVARAFAADSDAILLDDPFRGVDVTTKEGLYDLIRTEAASGRTVLWYSSENAEMQHCDRAYVFRAGKLAGELVGDDIDDAKIISLSFATSKETS